MGATELAGPTAELGGGWLGEEEATGSSLTRPVGPIVLGLAAESTSGTARPVYLAVPGLYELILVWIYLVLGRAVHLVTSRDGNLAR